MQFKNEKKESRSGGKEEGGREEKVGLRCAPGARSLWDTVGVKNR